MNMSKKITIIMPAYNASLYISDAIESILKQSYSNWQLIVIDDGSTDETESIVSEYVSVDPRIEYVYQENSGKPSIARNKGFESVKGDYVCFLDSDDLYHPDRLKIMIEVLSCHKEISCAFHDLEYITESGDRTGNTYLGDVGFLDDIRDISNQVSNGYILDKQFVQFMMLRYAAMHTATVIFSASLLKAKDLQFSTDIKITEDTEFWFKLAQQGNVLYVADILSYYRDTPGSVTKDKKSYYQDAFKMHYRTYCASTGKYDDEFYTRYKLKLASFLIDLAHLNRKNKDYSAARESAWKSLSFRCTKLGALEFLKASMRYS